MKDYAGNKTLLPLIPDDSPYTGTYPLLLHIIERLPSGPKCVIVNFKKEDVISAIQGYGIASCEQPSLNGTGGALLAARDFIEHEKSDHVIVTMGDVPFIPKETYENMIRQLNHNDLVILGFTPKDKKQYGILDISKDRVNRIVEWKFWNVWSTEEQENHCVCNAGIYAFKKQDLVRYLPALESRPQRIHKIINGKKTALEEFFITDIVEFMVKDGLAAGFFLTENETEAMGVDDLPALQKAQKWYENVRNNK